MKYLGIDYGTKKVGVAISDESGKFAFPKVILSTGRQLLTELVEMITQEDIGVVVVGNSLDQSGVKNAVMEDIDVFMEELHKLTGKDVVLSDERFTTTAVRAFDWSKSIATPQRKERNTDPIDDRAAAIMLQRYLDRHVL